LGIVELVGVLASTIRNLFTTETQRAQRRFFEQEVTEEAEIY
jgi:hypothetical protein